MENFNRVCRNCKASIPDDSVFCPSCGQKVETAPAITSGSAFRQAGSLDGSDFVAGTPAAERKPAVPREDTGLRFSSSFKHADSTPAAEPAAAPSNPLHGRIPSAAPMGTGSAGRCPHCGGSLDPDAVFCNNCGKKLSASMAEKAANKLSGIKMPKLPKKGVIAVASIALVLAVVLIVGAATSWFGTTGPAVQIASAGKNTLAAENFTADFTFTYNGYSGWREKVSGTAYVSFVPDKRELTAYVNLTSDGETGVIAIYDGYYIEAGRGRYWGDDISEQLDLFFDSYEKGTAEDFSSEDFLRSVLYEGISKDIDFDVLDTCLAAYFKKLNDKQWLKENAGYSVEKDGGMTKHCFSPNIHTFLKASFAEIEDAFIDEELHDEVRDAISELRAEAKRTDTDIVYGIKGGKLVHFDAKVTSSPDGLTEGDCVQVEADFYNIGKTTLDMEELEDLLAKVMEYEGL